MRAGLALLGVAFLILGAMNLLEIIGAAHPDKQFGDVFFAVLFFAVAILCGGFALRGTAGFSRRRCPSCGRRNARRVSLCQHCYRALPDQAQ